MYLCGGLENVGVPLLGNYHIGFRASSSWSRAEELRFKLYLELKFKSQIRCGAGGLGTWGFRL